MGWLNKYQDGGQISNDLLKRQAFAESSFDSNAVSKRGYKGLTQIGNAIITDYKKKTGVKNVDPFNIQDAYNVQKYSMNELYNSSFINKPNQSDEVRKAKTLAAYNWGRDNLFKFLTTQKKKGVDIYNSLDWTKSLPKKETRDYIGKVLGNDEIFDKELDSVSTLPKYKDIMNLYKDEFQDGGIVKKVDSILQANRKKLGWIDRLYEKNGENIQIPGVKGTSTHYMAQYDNYAVPLVTKSEEGKLQYIENPDTTYIKKHGIKFPSDKEALDFSQNYKKGTGVLPMFQDGRVIKDNHGQWDHPGEITEIDSNQITMKGVHYPVLGISDTGDKQMMYPGKDYKFKGTKVIEYPLAQDGDITKLNEVEVKGLSNPAKIKAYRDSLSLYNKGETKLKASPWEEAYRSGEAEDNFNYAWMSTMSKKYKEGLDTPSFTPLAAKRRSNLEGRGYNPGGIEPLGQIGSYGSNFDLNNRLESFLVYKKPTGSSLNKVTGVFGETRNITPIETETNNKLQERRKNPVNIDSYDVTQIHEGRSTRGRFTTPKETERLYDQYQKYKILGDKAPKLKVKPNIKQNGGWLSKYD